jgi:hypothetical protein
MMNNNLIVKSKIIEPTIPVPALRSLLEQWDKDSDVNWHRLAALCDAAEKKNE